MKMGSFGVLGAGLFLMFATTVHADRRETKNVKVMKKKIAEAVDAGYLKWKCDNPPVHWNKDCYKIGQERLEILVDKDHKPAPDGRSRCVLAEGTGPGDCHLEPSKKKGLEGVWECESEIANCALAKKKGGELKSKHLDATGQCFEFDAKDKKAFKSDGYCLTDGDSETGQKQHIKSSPQNAFH